MLNGRIKQDSKSSIKNALALQLLPLCFIISPFLYIFRRNIEEFAFTGNILFFVGGLYLFFNALLFAASHMSLKRTFKVCAFLLFYVLLMNIAKAVVPSLPTMQDFILNALFLIISGWSAYKIDLEKLRFIFFCSSALLMFNVGFQFFKTYTVYTEQVLRSGLSTQRSLTPSAQQMQIQTQTAMHKNGNVYHIVLDGFQTDAFYKAQDMHNTVVPDDFVHVDDFQSSYTVTSYSLSNIFFGEYYSADKEIYNWQYNDLSKGGLVKALDDAGVDVSLYPYYAYVCHENAILCRISSPYNDEEVAARSIYQISDMWFQYFVPSFLNDVLCDDCVKNQDAQALTDFGFSISSALKLSDPEFVPVQFFPYYSLKSLDRFKEDEKIRPQSGQYVFMHLEVPHPPFIYDQNCQTSQPITAKTVGNQSLTAYELYVMQSSCALTALNDIVNTIKVHGDYDNSMIIVHGDHGFKFIEMPDGQHTAFHLLDKETQSKMNVDGEFHQSFLDSFSDVLFLLKPRAGMNVSDEIPVQPIDIAPIIMEHFGLDTSEMKGLSLTALQDPQMNVREPQKLFFNFFEYPENRPAPFLVYQRSGDGKWDATETIPINWKGQIYYD